MPNFGNTPISLQCKNQVANQYPTFFIRTSLSDDIHLTSILRNFQCFQ